MKIGYRRVSSIDQNLDRQDLGEVDKVFEEKLSGANRDRPALKQMIEFARQDDQIIVYSIDRLARDLRDLQAIIEALNRKGVTISFLSERLSFAPNDADPLARLQLQMMGAFAEFERQIIRKRQAEGIAKAKAKGGIYKGRPKVISAAKVQELKAQGMGASAIAIQLGIGRASVYRLMET